MEEAEPAPKVSFIPCLTWVRQGIQHSKIKKVKPTKEELQEIMKEMTLRETEFRSRPEDKKKGGDKNGKEEDDDFQDVDDFYDMDNYDEEEIVEPPTNTTNLNVMLNQTDDEDSPDTDEEPDEFTIKGDDNLIVCGHVDGDVCMLEVYVFNNEKGELFILNDMFLPSYPICVEWLDFNAKNPDAPGNYAAVGCVAPEIDVWDLNLSGSLEPAFKLGSKKKKSMRHNDAVLDLSWNKNNRSVMASASADMSVILWDMANTQGVARIESFEEKVQSLKFHPFETQSLLTGCCDGKVRLYDCRNPKYFKTWGFDGEIERVLWNDFDPFYFFTTTEKGMVHYVDTRNDKPVWTLNAHEKEVTGICLSSHCKDLLMTGSMDESVKVWDLADGTPTFVSQKNMSIGQIYTLAACPDVPYVFCGGGSKKDNHLYVWDSRENDAVIQRFKGRKFEDAGPKVMEVDEEEVDPEEGNTEEASDPEQDDDSQQPSSSKAASFKGTSSIKYDKDGRIAVSRKLYAGTKKLVAAVAQSSLKPKTKKKSKKSHKSLHPKTPKQDDEYEDIA